MFNWLSVIVSPLNHVLFVVGADHVTWAELLGFLTGGACVWLTVRSSVLNFPVGIANSAFFLVLFAYAALWADAGLQIVFIALGAAGWWQWVTPGRARIMAVRWASTRTVLVSLAFVAVAAPLLTLVLRAADDAAPFWDALTTALSLAGQWLLNAKRVQTWWFWIAADIIYVPLYSSKHLTLTAAIYAVFLAMCVQGLRAWRAEAAVAIRSDVPELALR
jgi:nicotinamide mononucleotide transporter